MCYTIVVKRAGRGNSGLYKPYTIVSKDTGMAAVLWVISSSYQSPLPDAWFKNYIVCGAQTCVEYFYIPRFFKFCWFWNCGY